MQNDLFLEVCWRDAKPSHPFQYKKLHSVLEIWKIRIICNVKTSYHPLVKCFGQNLVNKSMNCLGVGILFSKVVAEHFLEKIWIIQLLLIDLEKSKYFNKTQEKHIIEVRRKTNVPTLIRDACWSVFHCLSVCLSVSLSLSLFLSLSPCYSNLNKARYKATKVACGRAGAVIKMAFEAFWQKQ